MAFPNGQYQEGCRYDKDAQDKALEYLRDMSESMRRIAAATGEEKKTLYAIVTDRSVVPFRTHIITLVTVVAAVATVFGIGNLMTGAW